MKRPFIAEQDELTYCPYCGFTVFCDDEAGTKITEHIKDKECVAHPLKQRIAELERQNEELTEARNAHFDEDCLFCEGKGYYTDLTSLANHDLEVPCKSCILRMSFEIERLKALNKEQKEAER